MTRGRVALVGLLLAASGCAGTAARGRPYIHKLELKGVRSVSEKDLRDKLAIVPSPWLPLLKKKYLAPFAVDDDRRRIEAYYRAHGFFAAHVVRTQVTPGKRGKAVDVLFDVDEGVATHLSVVNVVGAEDADVRRVVEEHLALARGQTFDYTRYAAQKDDLAGALKDAGYPFATVEGRVRVDTAARLAELTLQVQAGARAQIRGVEVRGTRKVNPAQVSRLASDGELGLFSLKKVEEVRARAYQLGVFTAVKVSYAAVTDRPDQVDLLLQTDESTMNELRLGGGLGLESQRTELHLSGRYVRRNFLGGLRTLQLTLTPGYVAIPAFWDPQRHGPVVTAEALLTQPSLGPLSKAELLVGYDLGIEYAYQYHGPRLSLAASKHLWRDRIQLALSYNFNYLDFFETDASVLLDPALAGPRYGYVDPYRVAWFQQELALDLRDAPLAARRGVYFGLTAEEGGVYSGSAFTYEKLLGEVRGYLPLGSRVVLAARLESGQLFNQGELGSPITRRFYLGGPSSHRGFNYNRLSPQVPGPPNSPAIPVGGNELLLAQAEVRVDLFTLWGQLFSFAVFWDAGDVADHIDVTDLHHAVGGGVRLKTLLGVVRLDVGVRLNRLAALEASGAPNPDPGDRVAFHLSLGEVF